MATGNIIDTTITVGNIIEAATIAIGVTVFVVSMKQSIGNMKDDLTDLKEEVKKVGEVLIKMAVTDQRLSNAEQDIRDLQHNSGFAPRDRREHS